MNVRGAPRVWMVLPRIWPRLDGDEAIFSLRVGQRATCAGKIRIDRRLMLINSVAIPPGGIALPEFDQRIGYGTAVVVEHSAADGDALAHRFAGVLAREVVVGFADVVMAENRPGDFRKRVRQNYQR